jgi:hypothetical protein
MQLLIATHPNYHQQAQIHMFLFIITVVHICVGMLALLLSSVKLK